MAGYFEPKDAPNIQPDTLTSLHWRPGRAMSTADPSRRAWVHPELISESGVDASEQNKANSTPNEYTLTYTNGYQARLGPAS